MTVKRLSLRARALVVREYFAQVRAAGRLALAVLRSRATTQELPPGLMEWAPVASAVAATAAEHRRRGHDAGHLAGRTVGFREAQAHRKANAEDTGILAAALHVLLQETGRTSVEFNELLARYGPGAFGIEPQRLTFPAYRASFTGGRILVQIADGEPSAG